MFCSKCGENLPEGAAFCRKCGAEVTEVAEAQQPIMSGGRAAAKSRKPIVIGSVVAAVVVMAAAAVFAYLSFFAPYGIDEKNFPDAAVRSALVAQADADNDGKLSRDEARAVTSLDLSGTSAASLEGLDKLSGLTSLDISGSGVAELDLSPFADLKTLDASGCASLAKVNLAGAAKLVDVNLAGTSVSSLDVSGQPGLVKLDLTGAPIASVDLSANTALSDLQVDENVALSGVESTLLREQWQVVEYKRNSSDGDGTQQAYDSVYKFTYDDSARLVKAESESTVPGGSRRMSSQTAVYEYDAAGRCVSMLSNGTTTGVSYDDQGRLSKVQVGKHYTTTYEYDADGHLVKAQMENSDDPESTHGLGQYTNTVYQYDVDGRISSMSVSSMAANTTTAYKYNDDGTLASIDSTDANGKTTTVERFTYDEAGRCVGVWTRGPYGALNDNPYEYSFSYDDQGNLVPGADLELTYDEHGNLVGRTFGNGLGSTEITYRRLITAKDAPDVFQPVEVGNPYTIASFPQPYTVNLMQVDDPIACSYGPLVAR